MRQFSNWPHFECANMFYEQLYHFIYDVNISTETSAKLQTATVVLSVTDDDDVEHTFTLLRVIHMPQSPVNILSARRLAEHFPDRNGNPDRWDTDIVSTFDDMFFGITSNTRGSL